MSLLRSLMSLCLMLWEKGKEGKFSASCTLRKPKKKRQSRQGAGKCPGCQQTLWPVLWGKNFGVTSSQTRRNLVWVKTFCRKELHL